MLGTYGSALIVCASSLLVGQAVLAVCGWRRWSWLAPALGLGPVTAIAWGAVQLPGEGAAAIGAVGVASALSLALLRGRLRGAGEAVRMGLSPAVVTVALVSIPFAVEGHFGVLGTGLNVDMSQHLFAGDWLADPSGGEPGLVRQGYPLGPHGLAVAAAAVTGGDIVDAFSGVTVAVPVLAALVALSVLRELPPARRIVAAALVALPYMVASYVAQGQFKEVMQAFYVLAFALCLHELGRGWAAELPAGRRVLAAVPLAAIALGAVYAYSAPGLAWLGGTAVLWAAIELVRTARWRGDAAQLVKATGASVVLGLVVLLAGLAPELPRVAEFRSNAAEVADAGDPEPAVARGAEQAARGGDGDAGGGRFNNDLGNLFDEISPLESLGIWPTGDFRLDPGEGAVPAIVFYAAAALGAAALLFGLARWLRRGETAVPVALAVAVAIYVAAWAVSTPYTAAKAIQMIAPLATLIAARELLRPGLVPASVLFPMIAPGPTLRHRLRVARPRIAGLALAALGIAFAAGAGGSTLLALANAPVGPDDYSRGLAELRSTLEGQPTLVLASPRELADEHARDFLAWEARGASPLCIEPAGSSAARPPPAGIRFVIATDGREEPPFARLALEGRAGPYVLWKRRGRTDTRRAPEGPAGEPTECGLALG